LTLHTVLIETLFVKHI